MNLVRKLGFIIATAIACMAPGVAQAGGIHPGYDAYAQLNYGAAWEAHEAGCLKWDFRTQAWYSRCGLPQFSHHRPHVLHVKW